MNEDGIMLSFAIAAGVSAVAGLLCWRKILVPLSGVLALSDELAGNKQVTKQVRNVREQNLESPDGHESYTRSLGNLSAALATAVNVEPAAVVSPAEETGRPLKTFI
jgi:hypothetical protein